MKKVLTVMVVGDELNGQKKQLLKQYDKDFKESSSIKTIKIQSNEIELHLWDSTGQEEYDRLRPLSYTGINLFILLYDTAKKSSFDNVLGKWYPELSHHNKKAPIVLVGLVDPTMNREVSKTDLQLNMNYTEILKYFECDLKSETGTKVETIFYESIAALLKIPLKTVPPFFKDFKKEKIYPHVQEVMELGKASRQQGHAFYKLPVEVLTHICDCLGDDLTTDKKSLHHFNRLLLGNVKDSDPTKLVWNRYLLLGNKNKLQIYPEPKPENKSIVEQFRNGAEEVLNKVKKFF